MSPQEGQGLPIFIMLFIHTKTLIVFDTFKATVKANPDAHPLFHSDRGFQYINRTFHHKNSLLALEQDMGGHLDPTAGGCLADDSGGSTTPPVSGTYDRKSALAYAAKWYAGNNPAFIWFGKNAQGQQSSVGGNGDCANFVSQCLYAGGMPMKRTGNARDQWYYDTVGGTYNAKSPSWSGAHELRRFIKYNTAAPCFTYEFLSSASGLAAGDLVFVLDRSNGESKANAKATHVAMVREVQGQTIYGNTA